MKAITVSIKPNVSLLLGLILWVGSSFAASVTAPEYYIFPSGPHPDDSVTLGIIKGTSESSCRRVYITSFNYSKISICAQPGCVDTFRLIVKYDTTNKWIDSLFDKYKEETIYQYILNGDVVYYTPPRCCDIPGIFYNSDGKSICNPKTSPIGDGDEKCPKVLYLKQTGLLRGKDASFCENPINPESLYGPYFELGKLARGHYQVYESSDSTKLVYSFSVSNAGTTNAQPGKGITSSTNRGGPKISISTYSGILTLSVNFQQDISVKAYHIDGRESEAILKKRFTPGVYQIALDNPAFKNQSIVFQIDGNGWRRSQLVHFTK